jgi:hypothetical protein
MAINSVTMTNAGARPAEIPGSLVPNDARVLVTGRVPINSEFQQDWGLPGQLVLPTDWARLATSGIASTEWTLRDQNQDIDPSQYWDIHDSSSPVSTDTPDIHVPGYCAGTSTTTDQVDNCVVNVGGEFGPFSRIFGDAGSGVGPFDPNYSETLLSDGLLNAADAPMPPLRVDFVNSGPFGFFVNSPLSDKHVVYSRNGLGSNTAHNLYAPYYGEYIPATSRNITGEAGGTDGPFLGVVPPPGTNNFEGYLVYGLYHFWDFGGAQIVRNALDGPSPCRLRDNTPPGLGVFRPLNAGPQVVAIYTDEHGEARISWLPGVGSDAFGTSVGFVDVNGGCDLEGVNLGTSTISALARYPFQNVANPVAATGTVVKSLLNRFHKDVTCVRKNNVGSAIAYICTASAMDITGSGNIFNGERVCFSREPDNIFYDVGGNTPHPNGYCVELHGGTAANFITGAPGSPAIATVETPATLVGSQIDIQAAFVDEHLLRDTCITVGVSPSAPGPCGAVGGGTTGGVGGGGTTTSGTTTSGTTTSGTTTGTTSGGGITSHGGITKAPAAKKKATVAAVQLVRTANGRYLMVKIASPGKTAKIQIRLINAKGKVISVVIRTVKTNKLVRVPNLRVGASVKTVRVRVAS